MATPKFNNSFRSENIYYLTALTNWDHLRNRIEHLLKSKQHNIFTLSHKEKKLLTPQRCLKFVSELLTRFFIDDKRNFYEIQLETKKRKKVEESTAVIYTENYHFIDDIDTYGSIIIPDFENHQVNAYLLDIQPQGPKKERRYRSIYSNSLLAFYNTDCLYDIFVDNGCKQIYDIFLDTMKTPEYYQSFFLLHLQYKFVKNNTELQAIYWTPSQKQPFEMTIFYNLGKITDLFSEKQKKCFQEIKLKSLLKKIGTAVNTHYGNQQIIQYRAILEKCIQEEPAIDIEQVLQSKKIDQIDDREIEFLLLKEEKEAYMPVFTLDDCIELLR